MKIDHNVSSFYFPSAFSSPCSPARFSLPLCCPPVFPSLFLFLSRSLWPPLCFQCCHVFSSLHHHTSRPLMPVKVLLDPIPLVMSSCKIAVFFSGISHSFYDSPAYPVVLCISLLQGCSIPLLRLFHVLTRVWDISLFFPECCCLLLERTLLFVICDSKENMHVSFDLPVSCLPVQKWGRVLSLLARKTHVLAGNLTSLVLCLITWWSGQHAFVSFSSGLAWQQEGINSRWRVPPQK